MTDELVHVSLPDGRIGTVPKSQLAQQIKLGARVSTPDEVASVKPVSPLGVAASVVGADNPRRTAAGLAGVARGATMGVSDQDAIQLAKGFGGEKLQTRAREELKSLREEHPTFSAAAELEGAILPSIASGGAAAPQALATAAEELAPKVLQEAAPLVERAAPALEEGIASKFPGYVADVGKEGQILEKPILQQLEQVVPEEVANAHRQAVSQIGSEILGETSVGKALGAPTAAAAGGTAMPADLVAHVGDLVERGVVKALGTEGETLLGKMLVGGAKTGARGAAEGAIYGAVDELNEERLGDSGLNGEKMLSSIGHGALLGGAGGVVIGSGSPLARHIAGEAATYVSRQAGEQAFRALSPHAKGSLVAMAERVPGGTRAVGEKLLEMKLMRGGDAAEDILMRVAPAKKETGTALATLRDTLDTKGVNGPEVARIFSDFEETAQRHLEALPSLNKGALDKIAALRDDIASYAVDGKLSFNKAQELRSRIDESIRFTAPAPGAPKNELNDSLIKMRTSFENEVEHAIERGGSGHTPEYKQLKDTYRKLSIAEDILEDGIKKTLKNRKISPTDYLVGLGGLAAGHPIAGILGSLAHHVVRERGNSTAAVLLDKIGSMAAVRDAAARVDRQINRGVGRAFGEKLAPVSVRDKLFPGPANNNARMDAVIRSVSEDHGTKIGQQIAPIANHAPATAGAFVKTAIRAAAYLRSLLPEENKQLGLQPHLRDVSEDMDSKQKARFERAFHVVNDPPSILVHLGDGTITPDEVEALKTTHPKMYAQMQDAIATRLSTTKGPIPRDLRNAIATFMGDPAYAGPASSPEYVDTMQRSYAPPQQPKGGRRKGGGGKKSSSGVSGLLGVHDLSGAVGKDFKL